MATNPMAASGAQDPEDAQDGGADESQEQGGYVIMIHVDGSGKLSVGVESDQEEAAEGETPGDGSELQEQQQGQSDDDMVPCSSIKEALTTALEIYKADGQMPAEADDNFQQGFSGSADSGSGSY